MNIFKKENDEAITKWELVIILLFFVVASLWACFMPENTYAPDEKMRYLVPKYIYNHNKLPLPDDPEVIRDIYNASYAYYPFWVGPLVSSGLMKIAGIFGANDFALLVAARFSSVLFGTLFVYLLIKIINELFSSSNIKWLGILLGATIPQLMFLSSYVNNDIIALAAAAMMLLAWLKAMKNNWNYKNALLLSVGIIICALSYYNAYGWVLASIIIFISSFIKKEEKWSFDYKGILKYGLFISVIVLVGITFPFVRNYKVTGGDFLGMDSFLNACEEGAIDELKPSKRQTPEKMGMSIFEMLTTNKYNEEASWFENTYKSFVSVLGKMKFTAPLFTYIVYGMVFTIGALGFIIKLFSDKLNGNEKILYINLLLVFIIPIVLTIKYSYSTDYQAQGRYIYPIWLALIVFTTTGWEFLCNKFKDLIDKKYVKKVICVVSMMLLAYIIISTNYTFFTSIKLV